MLQDEGFTSGKFHIHYAEERMEQGLCQRDEHEIAALLGALAHDERATTTRETMGRTLSAWASSSLPKVR